MRKLTNWDNIKLQAIINQFDKLTPGKRKEIITNRYCLKCWRNIVDCECLDEEEL